MGGLLEFYLNDENRLIIVLRTTSDINAESEFEIPDIPVSIIYDSMLLPQNLSISVSDVEFE